MTLLIGSLALTALMCGLIAARYAQRAANVPVDPGWTSEPVIPELKQMEWTAATLKAMQMSAGLSRIAAGWTVGAVILGTLVSLAGLYG